MSVINVNQANFDNEVMRSGKTVLLDFFAPWCSACRMTEPVMQEIEKERLDIKVGKVNVDEQPELASQFGVMSIPTFVVLKNGKVVKQAVGAQSKQAIFDLLQGQ